MTYLYFSLQKANKITLVYQDTAQVMYHSGSRFSKKLICLISSLINLGFSEMYILVYEESDISKKMTEAF